MTVDELLDLLPDPTAGDKRPALAIVVETGDPANPTATFDITGVERFEDAIALTIKPR